MAWRSRTIAIREDTLHEIVPWLDEKGVIWKLRSYWAVGDLTPAVAVELALRFEDEGLADLRRDGRIGSSVVLVRKRDRNACRKLLKELAATADWMRAVEVTTLSEEAEEAFCALLADFTRYAPPSAGEALTQSIV